MNKPVQINEELHKRMKKISIESGIKIKHLVESAIERYLNLIKIEEVEK
jgi:hypothetical protein